jgi:hypothetical protein
VKPFDPLRGFANWKGSAHDPEPTPRGVTAVHWSLVLAGVAGDGIAFFLVINVVLGADFVTGPIYSAGFASVAIGLAHAIGAGRARMRWRDPKASRGLWLCCLLAWLLLGGASFLVRLWQPPAVAKSFGAAAPLDSPFTAALLFLALFVASGVLAAITAYMAFNPLRVVVHRLRYAVANEASSRAALMLADQDVDRYQALRGHESIKRAAARRQVKATMFELQNHARYLMAVGRAYPPTTEGLTKDGPRPDLTPQP